MKDEIKKISSELEKYRANGSTTTTLDEDIESDFDSMQKKVLASSINFVEKRAKWDVRGEWVPLRHRFPINEWESYCLKDCRQGDREDGSPVAYGIGMYNGWDFGNINWEYPHTGLLVCSFNWQPTHWMQK